MDAVGGPLALTSANISGTSIDGLVSAALAAELFGDKIEVFVPAVDSDTNTTQSSTIVSLLGGSLNVVRQGDIVVQ